MMIIRRKEDNNFWNILIIHKRVKMYTGKKNAGIKTHIYSDFILPHWPKKVILKLRLFSKKILKRIMWWWWWWCLLKQIFSFPSLSKRSSKQNKKKLIVDLFFSSAKFLQEFMWWYMIIIFQLFRLFSARLCY